MTVLIWVITLVALAQFVWYSIAAPAIRMRLRYDLFCQRDRLRHLKIELGQQLCSNVYNTMEGSINSAIQMLPAFEISVLFTFQRELARNEPLREKIERRIALIEDCPIPEVRRIRKIVGTILMAALGVNSAGWLVWLAPIIVAMFCAKAIRNLITQLLSVRLSETEQMGLTPSMA